MTTDTNAAPVGGDDEDNLIDDATMTEMEATPPLSKEPEKVEDADDGQELPVDPLDLDTPADPAAADGEKTKFVPHAKYNKTYQDLKEQRRTNQVLEERTNQLLGILGQQNRQQQPAEPEQQMPELPTDPLEKIEFLSKWYEQSQQQFQQEAVQRRQQQEQQTYMSNVANWAEQDHAQRLQEDPTYEGAYEHLINSRVKELSRTVPPQQAKRQAIQEALQVSAMAHQQGQRPSDMFIAYAEARGWQPKVPEQQQQPDLAAQEQRREQHLSLSQMGGKAGRGSLTAKDLASMDEDAFAKLKDSVVSGLMGA